MRSLNLLYILILLLTASAVSASPIIIASNHDHILPIGRLADRDIAIISLGADQPTEFVEICQRYAMIETEHVSSDAQMAKADDLAIDSDIIIAAVSTSERWAREALQKLASARPVVAVFFIAEKTISLFKAADKCRAVVISDSGSKENQSLAAQTIFGGKAADSGKYGFPKSRLGYSQPDRMGFSADLEHKIDSIVERNISHNSFPGCQVLVARKGEVVIDKAYGTLSRNDTCKVRRTTLFDIASMTKATATLAGLMKAYDRGLFQLDNPIADYLPRMRDSIYPPLTVRDFLLHETGLPSMISTYAKVLIQSIPENPLFSRKSKGNYTIKIDDGLYADNTARLNSNLFSSQPSRDYPIEIARNIFACDSAITTLNDALYSAKYGPRKYRYSDINFCILKDMEEALTETPHDHWVDAQIFLPIGAHHTTYCPISNGWEPNEIAPTEYDRLLRRQHLHGYVHDETAAFLGGVSGNAGLFSTAGDIAKLCQTWLNRGIYGDVRLFSEETVKLFTTTHSAAKRGLGFDLACRQKSLNETGINPNAYGHTGFTGTCFWVDPDREIIIVILTNRVNPSRINMHFIAQNPRENIIRAVYSSLNENAPSH